MMIHTPLLVIGAGPYGLSIAKCAQDAGVDTLVLGEPMAFVKSDCSFVDAYIDDTINIPGWFRRLPPAERDLVSHRFWSEGRLKLEPWLTPRLASPAIHCWPQSEVTACNELPNGEIQVTLSNGERLIVDHLLLGTGYSADVAKIPYLEGVLENVAVVNGSPVLDECFQSSVSALFFAGFLAVRDFGPFFGFVRGCTAAATLIVRALAARAELNVG